MKMSAEELITRLGQLRDKINSVPDAEQRKYIQYMMEARELYRKEVMSDEDYQRSIDSLVSDDEKLRFGSQEAIDRAFEERRQQFERDHISQSVYDEQMDRITKFVTELDENYGFGQGIIGKEHDVDVQRKRTDLLTLQEYFRNTNNGIANNIMFDGDRRRVIEENDIVNMSANDLIDYYERVREAYEMRGVVLEEFVKEIRRQKIRDRVKKSDGNTGGSDDAPTGENGNKSEEEKIKESIEAFRSNAEKMKEEINKVKAELVLGDENKNFELTDAVRGLDSEFAELVAESDALIGEIDAFVNETGSADFSMTPAQIKKRVSELGKSIRDLKQNLVHKYDARVALTNAKIAELKNRTDLTPEIAELINGLTELQLCGVTVQNWKHHSFLKDIDFNKLMEVNKLIADIESKKIEPNPVPVPPVDDTTDEKDKDEMQHPMIKLDADIMQIESEILKLDSEVVPGLSPADLADKIQRLDDIETLINNFKLGLENNKDSMPEEEYNRYVERIEDAIADVALLYSKLHEKDKGNGPEDEKDKDVDYKELSSKADKLSSDIDKLYDDVVAFKGLVAEGAISVFEKRLAGFEQELADLKKDIEDRKTAGKLDENQYNNLINKVNAMEQKLKETKAKINDPGMVKDADIFEILNGRIDGLEKAIEKLETQVNDLKAPIKDKETRKNIEKVIDTLEDEIRFLEESLEKYKNEDVNKYNDAKVRLDNAKDRLNNVCELYRKKCPLRVRAIKGAKNFYKKHPKLCLLVAGLAAVALVHATVGPVLIPAIMHGNLMIMNKLPILRPFFKFTNNILGRLINASIQTVTIGNTSFAGWVLANGAVINPSCAATSLLKGVAISGIGSTLLVAPIVVAIKELVEKMKTAELKQKLTESVTKGKERIGESVSKGKEKLGDTFKKKKNYDKLVKEFMASGMSLEEFCKKNELNEKDMEIIGLKVKLNEALAETAKSKGRR